MPSYKLLSEALQRDVYRLSSRLSAAESNNALLLKDLKVRDASIAELVEELRKTKGIVEELQKVIRHTRETIDDLTAKNDRLAGLAAESADHAASMAEKLLELQKDRDGWKSMSDQWMDKAYQAEQDFKQLQVRVEELEAQKTDYERALSAAKTEIGELQHENESLRSRLSEMERWKDNCMNALMDAQTRNARLKEEVTQRESAIKQCNRRIQELEEDDCEFRLALDAASEERDRFAVQLEEEREKSKALATRLESLEKINNGLHQEKDSLHRELLALQNRLANQERIEALEAHIKQKQEDYRHVCEELRIAHATADALLRAIQAISQWQTIRK